MLSASIAAAFVVLIGIGLFLLLRSGTGLGPNRPPATSAVAGSAENVGQAGNAAGRQQPLDTLAVLPFENLSADPEAGYLGDDITYSLTDSLARVRELKVRPYNSVARFKPGSLDAKAAGGELQVQAVLRGSIQQRGGNVLIDVELIHVGEDRRLWGQRYQGKLTERLTLQQQISQEVPEQLRLSLTGQEKQTLARLPTSSVKAHELYTLGRLAWNRRTQADFHQAIAHFQQAIQMDASYAQAHAGLADCYLLLPLYGYDFPKQSFPRAREAAQRALALAPGLAEAHITLAEIHFYYDWDFVAAEREFLRALDLKPNYPTGRQWYGEFLSYLGRHSEALAELDAARRGDPDSFIIHFDLGKARYFARQYDEATAQLAEMLRGQPQFSSGHRYLGASLTQKGSLREAIAELEEAWRLSGQSRGAHLAGAYVRAGEHEKARDVLKQLRQLAPTKYVPPIDLAITHAALGENEEALVELERGYRERASEMVELKVEPMFDSLREEPRFQKIVADMKFPQ